MNAAIYFYPEAYSTSGPKVMGRNSAGESFLKGYAAHSTATEFWTLVERRAHAKFFAQAMRDGGRKEPVNAVDKNNLGILAKPGMVYYPAPKLAPLAYKRAAFGHTAWSLCGITHTLSTTTAMDALADLLVAPLQAWDALICTSTAAKDNVTRVLQTQADYLKERMGATNIVLPQLPVIPLGINTQDFVSTAAQRVAARQALGVDDATIVVLFLGRLSFHAKAHPLAQYLALENAARATNKKIVLLECGWHAGEPIRDAFEEAAQAACPSVRVVTLDSSAKPENRPLAWAAADIFSSLSDNIQETFGLTPLEGMAAGLPLVVSDWNGYKDTVRDGVDGFRVPTLMPQAGLGSDLALRHALEIDNFDMYCGFTSLLIAVDIDATAAAFTRLIENPQLRRQMGDAGRKRVREHYDWSVIIPRYEALWAELGELRNAQARANKPAPWPARMDPFHAFSGYPTSTLTAKTRLQVVDAGTALERIHTLRKLKMVEFGDPILPTDDEIRAVLSAAAEGQELAADLVTAVPAKRRALVLRGLAWLVKIGILKVCP
jgi:starch synthase